MIRRHDWIIIAYVRSETQKNNMGATDCVELVLDLHQRVFLQPFRQDTGKLFMCTWLPNSSDTLKSLCLRNKAAERTSIKGDLSPGSGCCRHETGWGISALCVIIKVISTIAKLTSNTNFRPSREFIDRLEMFCVPTLLPSFVLRSHYRRACMHVEGFCSL